MLRSVILIMALLSGCQVQNFDDNDTANTSSSSNGTPVLIHHQGQSCSSCHNSNSPIFQTGGTLYALINEADLDAGLDLSDYTIRLKNSTTTLNFTAANANGNFYTTAPVSGTDFYIQILNRSGVIINQSPANHGSTKMDCNGCHTQNGQNGTKGRIVGAVSFSKDVRSYLSNCIGCHGGQGGFTVSYSAVKSRVDLNTPADSLLLLKGTATSSHNGGAALGTSAGYRYRGIYEWIRQGALNN